MPTSVHLYRDVLGFDTIASSGPGDDFDWGLLRLNDCELMLNTAYDASPARPRPIPPASPATPIRPLHRLPRCRRRLRDAPRVGGLR